jgi:hypothetical protein
MFQRCEVVKSKNVAGLTLKYFSEAFLCFLKVVDILVCETGIVGE